MSDTIGARVPPALGDRALDAYSQVVTEVAAELTLRVAALQMSHRRRDGRVEGSAGSAVVFTDDGFLLTMRTSWGATAPAPRPSPTGRQRRSV